MRTVAKAGKVLSPVQIHRRLNTQSLLGLFISLLDKLDPVA